MKKVILLIAFFAAVVRGAQAQDARIDSLARRLDALAASGVQLNQPISITFDGLTKDLISFLAESTKLNMTAMPGLEASTVSVSFTNAPARDVVLHLCYTNRLDLRFTGSIITFLPFSQPPPVPPPARAAEISYEPDSGFLTLNLRDDTLDLVAQKIARLTGRNLVLDPSVRFTRVNGYIEQASLESALKQLAGNNNLNLKREADYFRLESRFPAEAPAGAAAGQPYNPNRSATFQIERSGTDQVNIQAVNADVLDVLKEAAAQLDIDYYLLPEGGPAFSQAGFNNGPAFNQPGLNAAAGSGATVTIQARQIAFRDLLRQIFKNTSFDFTEKDGLYIVGRRTAESMRGHKIFQFQNRSVRGVTGLIPESYKYDIAIDTMPELNSIILSGSQQSIRNVEQFFTEIDKLVPVILIEVVLIDVQTDKLSDLGLEAGVTKGGIPAGGSVISSTADKGGINFSFSPNAINDLLKLLAGRDIINLGRVSPDFYLTLKAVQEDGIIEIKSTPKLSTLNSHRATLSIGQTRYYQEQQVSYPGTDRPVPVQATVFREAAANLDIDITPITSGDDQVTLNIYFEQSEFIGESTLNAPPPKVSRKFESLIRVRNGEMVVLGGLEYESKSKTRRGVPILSKIPLIGWLFGRTKKMKQKDKLLIFVKPTIVN